MSLETIIVVIVAVALLASISNPYWWQAPDVNNPPAPNWGGTLNALLYIILVIVVLKLLLGVLPL